VKHIAKGSEPEFLLEFKRGESPDWQPSYAALGDDVRVRNELKAALLAEQGWLCCYCCQRIEAVTSHFEHLLPQEGNPQLDLEYSNLLASCSSEGPHRHCGARKGNRKIEITPLQPDCEEHFNFDLLGAVAANPTSLSRAEKTIEILGLNQPLLRESRRQAIVGFTENIDQLSNSEIGKLIRHLNRRDTDGKFEPYQPAIVQALTSFAATQAESLDQNRIPATQQGP
jgi:uncharacterized protein (TIGR02646 family)